VKKELLKLGLSDYKARTLSTILELGNCTIPQIAKKSGLPTSKLYEIIQNLSSAGFISIISQKPITVQANDIKSTIRNHVNEKKAELEQIQQNIENMQFAQVSKATQFEVVNGRDAFFIRVKKAVSSSKKEICAIVRNYRLDFDLKQRIAEFTKNGGELRLIGPKVSSDKTKHWKEVGAKIRFLEVPSTRFTIWDGQKTAIGFKDQSYDYFSLWINDSVVGKSFQKMFDEYWEDAKGGTSATSKAKQ